MPDTRWKTVQDQFAAQIAAAVHPNGGPATLIPAGNLFRTGDMIDNTKGPITCLIGFDDQDSVEENTSGKQRNEMPATVMLKFDIHAGSLGLGAMLTGQIEAVQSEVFVAIYNSVMSTEVLRQLNGAARPGVKFTGGGTKLNPEDNNEPPDRWSITMNFTIRFGHKSSDATVAT